MVSPSDQNIRLFDLIKSKLHNHLLSVTLEHDAVVVAIRREHILDFFKLLKLDSELKFNMLLSVTAVDWMDLRDSRFQLVYHLLSIPNLYRLRVKIDVSEESTTVDSLVGLWASANYMEREVWDMYGIAFKGHPNLKRILMYEEFEGYPLRKDYPVQGKQPRIPLRSPEVRNTAMDMSRPPLVQINSRQKAEQSSSSYAKAGPGDHSRFVEQKYN